RLPRARAARPARPVPQRGAPGRSVPPVPGAGRDHPARVAARGVRPAAPVERVLGGDAARRSRAAARAGRPAASRSRGRRRRRGGPARRRAGRRAQDPDRRRRERRAVARRGDRAGRLRAGPGAAGAGGRRAHHPGRLAHAGRRHRHRARGRGGRGRRDPLGPVLAGRHRGADRRRADRDRPPAPGRAARPLHRAHRREPPHQQATRLAVARPGLDRDRPVRLVQPGRGRRRAGRRRRVDPARRAGRRDLAVARRSAPAAEPVMRRRARAVAAPAALVELGLLAGAIALAWSLVPLATGRWLARVAELSPALAPAPGAVESSARIACLAFTGGVLALAIGRAIGLGRAAARPRAPLLLPAAALAGLPGLVLHAATVESAYRAADGARELVVLAPGAAGFATGVLLGGLVGGALLALPADPGELARRAQVPLLIAILAVFAALALAGSGPGESGTRINLGPVQPIEAVKPAFVAFLAAYLGRRAGKLRWQRARLAGLRWPRPALLVPALAGLIALFAGLFLVRDLGPTLILSIVFLALLSLDTPASGWVLAAAARVAALLVLSAWRRERAGGGSASTRLAMWRDPWQNALSHGHQLGEGLWAIPAG